MGLKRTLVVLLVMGTLAIELFQIGLAKDENDNRNVSSDEYSEEVLASLSTWNVEFEEGFDEGWDSSSLTGQLDASSWEQAVDDERTALRVECNCWVEMPGSYSWQDYAFTTSVKIDHGEVNLSFRQCGDGRYFVGIEEGRLFLGKEQPWGHRVTIATAPFPIALNEWYDIMIVGIGSELAIFLDGKLQIRHNDGASPILAGGISYETCGGNPVLLIDRIQVHSGDRQDPQALLDMGYVYLDEQNNEAAYEAFAEAAELFRAEKNKSGEAEALHHMGKALISSGDALAAIDPFQRALEILQEIGARASEAWCHMDIGNAHMQLDDLPAAAECFELARDRFVALSDREGEIEALRSEGQFLVALAEGFRQVKNPVGAIWSLQGALRAFRDAGDEREEAVALMRLGSLYYGMQQYAELALAVDCFEQAEALFLSIGKSFDVAAALAYRSWCYVSMGQFDLALEYGEKALSVHRSCGGDAGGEAEILASLSGVYSAQGELQRAIDYCLMAVSLRLELGDMGALPENLSQLSYYYAQAGETELAAEYQQQSIDLGLNLEGMPLADALRFVGDSHMRRGDLPAAIASVEAALAICRELGSRGMEAVCLGTLANYYKLSGQSQEAIEYAQEIVAIGQAAKDPEIEIAGLKCLSDIHRQLGRFEEGILFLEQCLQIALDNGELELLMGLYRQLADLYQELGRLEEAIEFLELSLQIAQDTGAIDMQVGLRRQMAELCRSTGRLEDARTHYELAIDGMENTFGGLEIESLQDAFFPRVRQLYVEYFMLLLAMDDVDETLWVAERCRARTYVEQLGRADLGLLDFLPESGIRSGVISAEQVEQDAREAIQNLPTNTAAIEYFVADGQTFVWVLRDGIIYGPRQIDVPKAELQRRVVEFRTSIETASQGMSSRPDDELLVMARDLHQLLVAPIAEWLEEIDHIVIVPSGPLYYLPFASLLECPECVGIDFLGGEYLIERYSISYTPSLSTLHFIQQRQLVGQEEPNLLALADPVSTDSTMPRLPEAQDEAQAIALLFSESEIFVDEAATEDALRQRVADAGHLLLSTHGWFDAGNPMYSYLMLTPTATSDGRLHTYEVFELPLQADLVTLSACETLLPALEAARDTERTVRGVSDDVPIILSDEQLNELTTGDDVVGLTRAFLYAGSSSVLSTLWRVVSETTEQLMVAFYGYMEGGLDKATALRQAQLDVMAIYPHPRYWAAFDLMGGWR